MPVMLLLGRERLVPVDPGAFLEGGLEGDASCHLMSLQKTSQSPEIWLSTNWSMRGYESWLICQDFLVARYNRYTVRLQTIIGSIDSLQKNSESLEGDCQFSASAIARGAVSSWCSWGKFLWHFFNTSSDPEIIVFYTFRLLFCQLGNL